MMYKFLITLSLSINITGVALGVSVFDVWLMAFYGLSAASVFPVEKRSRNKKLFGVVLIVSVVRFAMATLEANIAGVSAFDYAHLIVASSLFALSWISSKYVNKFLMGILLVYHLFLAVSFFSLPHFETESKCAYLERGKWGITHVEGNGLNLQSQYSYSLIKKALHADAIKSLDALSGYNVLWIVTPTEIFSQEEVVRIVEWVADGGRLVVVTDHTDLFGHASVLRELLSNFEISLGKDCVIPKHGRESPYLSPCRPFIGLTANSIYGRAMPILVQLAYRELADYNGRSFFSDNSVTDEDLFGLYCVSCFKRHGNGSVMVFGDSTLFADFAFSRPSSQLAFRMLRDHVNIIDWPLLIFLLNAIVFICHFKLKKYYRYLLLLLACFIGIAYFCLFAVLNRIVLKAPLFAKHNVLTQSISGDWNLVDGEFSKYSVLFSAAYAQRTPFPEWIMNNKRKGLIASEVEIGMQCPKLSEKRILLQELSSDMELSLSEFVDDLVRASQEDSIWFDSGVGIFKECAYRNFWENKKPTEAHEGLMLDNMLELTVNVYSDGERIDNVKTRIHKLRGNSEWCIIGNMIVGKVIEEKILIKDKWQHPHRKYGDIVLEVVKNGS